MGLIVVLQLHREHGVFVRRATFDLVRYQMALGNPFKGAFKVALLVRLFRKVASA